MNFIRDLNWNLYAMSFIAIRCKFWISMSRLLWSFWQNVSKMKQFCMCNNLKLFHYFSLHVSFWPSKLKLNSSFFILLDYSYFAIFAYFKYTYAFFLIVTWIENCSTIMIRSLLWFFSTMTNLLSIYLFIFKKISLKSKACCNRNNHLKVLIWNNFIKNDIVTYDVIFDVIVSSKLSVLIVLQIICLTLNKS